MVVVNKFVYCLMQKKCTKIAKGICTMHQCIRLYLVNYHIGYKENNQIPICCSPRSIHDGSVVDVVVILPFHKEHQFLHNSLQ